MIKHTLSLALVATLATTVHSYASNIVAGDVAAGGIGYYNQVTLGGSDSASFSSHVGAWSWEDEGVFTPGVDAPVGWTHTSNWVALDLSVSSTLSVTVSRDAAVAFAGSGNVGGFADTAFMYPSFTLWRNWDNDDADNHTYENTSNVSWAEDLVYLGHLRNTKDPSASASWTLPAGQYTLVIGSDAPSSTNPPRQGYSALLTTSPVPEPTGVALIASAIGLVGARRRRS